MRSSTSVISHRAADRRAAPSSPAQTIPNSRSSLEALGDHRPVARLEDVQRHELVRQRHEPEREEREVALARGRASRSSLRRPYPYGGWPRPRSSGSAATCACTTTGAARPRAREYERVVPVFVLDDAAAARALRQRRRGRAFLLGCLRELDARCATRGAALCVAPRAARARCVAALAREAGAEAVLLDERRRRRSRARATARVTEALRDGGRRGAAARRQLLRRRRRGRARRPARRSRVFTPF